MNTETGETREQTDEHREETITPGAVSKGPPLAGIAMLLSLLALLLAAGGIYLGMQPGPDVPDIDPLQDRLLNMQAAVNTGNVQLRRLEDELERLRQQQQAILGSITALNREDNYTLDTVLIEIETLLVIASQHLVLSKDVTTALAALQSAEDRLRNFNEPALLQLRQALTADMNNLRDVETVDISGLALYLADIAARVRGLPLKRLANDPEQQQDSQGPRTGDSNGSVFSRLGDEVLSTLKDLVKVYPSEGGAVISLLPEQQYYLYQNLRLQIEIARLSVMRGETENFRASIASVQDWLTAYFETSDKAVSNVIDSLSGMQGIDLDPPVPDINSSLETLRALIRQRPAAGEPQNGIPSE